MNCKNTNNEHHNLTHKPKNVLLLTSKRRNHSPECFYRNRKTGFRKKRNSIINETKRKKRRKDGPKKVTLTRRKRKRFGERESRIGQLASGFWRFLILLWT
jgi:hypothetical protein